MTKTVRFYTLGCKVNQYDSEAMLETFLAAGYTAAPQGAPADVYVVNTCTVTGTGDQKSLQAARRFKRQNPDGELILTGCLAQRKGEELRDTGARLILGTQYRGRVVELLTEAVENQTQIIAVDSLQSAPFEPLRIHAHEGHTRAVMKIQEGCDNRCTYCIIPSVRGGIRSRPIEDITAEAEPLARAGFKELVLTGIHLTSFGRDQPDKPLLTDAIRAVERVSGVERIRLGSLEPVAITDGFVKAATGFSKLCPQFHLALQSGSDTVLWRMKRRYNTAQFERAAKRLSTFPKLALTTDVIVGFPGETEAEFEQTLAFCRRIGFLKVHVFPFSPREGTPAAGMADQIPEQVKAERVHRLIALGEELSVAYRTRLLGTVQPVLVEERLQVGLHVGYTPQYVHVACEGGSPGKISQVKLETLTREGMSGTVVE